MVKRCNKTKLVEAIIVYLTLSLVCFALRHLFSAKVGLLFLFRVIKEDSFLIFLETFSPVVEQDIALISVLQCSVMCYKIITCLYYQEATNIRISLEV